MAKKAARKRAGKSNGNGANLGFEANLWLAAELNGQFAVSRKLEKAIRKNLASLGFDT